MKTITRSSIYLPMSALILTAALAIPAAAQTQVPFVGTFEGIDTVTPPATITTIATGTGTLLGQFKITQVTTITPTGVTGTAYWTAANRDTIVSTFVALATPGPVVFKITEFHTITSGTGRFTGAQGSFTVDREHIVTPIGGSGDTHVTRGSFGTITLGAAH